MKRSAVALLLALLSVALISPAGERGGRRISFDSDDQPEATYAQGALEWRLMTLRGPDGPIPRDGLVRARGHVQRMRARTRGLGPAPQTCANQAPRAPQPPP